MVNVKYEIFPVFKFSLKSMSTWVEEKKRQNFISSRFRRKNQFFFILKFSPFPEIGE